MEGYSAKLQNAVTSLTPDFPSVTAEGLKAAMEAAIVGTYKEGDREWTVTLDGDMMHVSVSPAKKSSAGGWKSSFLSLTPFEWYTRVEGKVVIFHPRVNTIGPSFERFDRHYEVFDHIFQHFGVEVTPLDLPEEILVLRLSILSSEAALLASDDDFEKDGSDTVICFESEAKALAIAWAEKNL